MRDIFTFDSESFLISLAELRARFEQVVAASALSFDGIDDDAANPIQYPEHAADDVVGVAEGVQQEATGADGGLPSGRRGEMQERMRNCEGKVDARILALSAELFAGTCWASLIGVASLGFDGALVESARNFMMRTAMCVQQQGLAVWLHGLIADASSAHILGKVSPLMPATIRPMSRIQMRRWMGGGPERTCGTKRQRLEDIDEYRKQTHRLAAYSLLRWGSPVDVCNRIASLMLSDPPYGISLLREDPNLRLQGVAPDMRVDRALAYIRHLRVQGDMYYGRAVQRHWDMPELDGNNHTEVTEAMDRRYLYDVGRLIASYRALWDRDVPKADAILEEVMQTHEYPRMKLWENPVYLRDIARSLVGASLAAGIVEGFEARDVQRFEAGVARLRTVARMVESMTLLLMPIALSDAHEPKWSQLNRGGYRARTKAWRRYCDVGADLALIVLNRIDRDDEQYRATAAAALMQLDVQRYCEMTIPLFQPPKPIETDATVQERVDADERVGVVA